MSATNTTFPRAFTVFALALVVQFAGCTQDATIAELTQTANEKPSTTPYGDGELCGGEVAERVFSFSVCTCEDLALAGSLQTYAIGGGDGSGGAAVGINDGVSYAGDFDVDGTVEIGASNLSFAGGARVNGDLAVGGDVTYAGSLEVARDLTSEGRVIGIGSLDVAGEQRQGDVALPCGCGDDELLDVAAVVKAAATSNDNEALGVDATAFSAVVGEQELVLSGGSVYLDSVAGAGTLRIVASAPTLIHIGGDVSAAGSIEAVVEGDGALDIFIAGNLSFAGEGTFGPIDNPGKVRVYVSGTGGISMAGGAKFAGNLYAPRAQLSAAGSLEVHGSVFARDISLAGDLVVYHDRAVQSAGDECEPPVINDPPQSDTPDNTCETTLECGSGQVCSGSNECTSCNEDADCEGAQVCQSGACQPLLR